MNDVFFGGSFDPPHLGHLLIATEACDEIGCSGVLFVPVGRNPFKPEGPVTAGEDRLEMVRRLVSDDPRFSVSPVEVERAGPSRTYDTVLHLIDNGTLVQTPWMLIGEELLPDLPRWYRSEELLSRVRLAVVRRSADDEDRRADGPVENTEIRWISNPRLNLSSSELRDRLKRRRSVRYLIPDNVYDYIDANSLYR